MLNNLVKTIVLAMLAVIPFTAASTAQVTFLDHRKKTIKLDAPPKRLVTIVRSAPLIYRAIDESARHIAGMNRDSLDRYFSRGLYAELLPEMSGLNATAAKEGFKPNVEAILGMNPDLVVQWIYDPKIIEPLERVGLEVVGWNCCTEDHRRDYLTLSGYISGKMDRAQTMLALQDRSDSSLAEKFGKISTDKIVDILEIDQLNDQIRVIANGSQNLSLSGVRNLAADDTGQWWRTIDAEQLLAWNPEIIFIPAYATGLDPDAFYNNPLLASLKAVKTRRVYKIPAFGRTPDAPEIYLTAPWIALIAHGADAAPDFIKQIVTAYQTIYGAKLTDVQINNILETGVNAESQDYSKLFGDV